MKISDVILLSSTVPQNILVGFNVSEPIKEPAEKRLYSNKTVKSFIAAMDEIIYQHGSLGVLLPANFDLLSGFNPKEVNEIIRHLLSNNIKVYASLYMNDNEYGNSELKKIKEAFIEIYSLEEDGTALTNAKDIIVIAEEVEAQIEEYKELEKRQIVSRQKVSELFNFD